MVQFIVMADEITKEVIDFIDKAWSEWLDFTLFEEIYDNVLDLLDKFESGQELTEQETNWVLFCYDDMKNNK